MAKMGLRYRRNDDNSKKNTSKYKPDAPWKPRLPKFLKKKKILPKQDEESARNLSANFCEQTWDMDKIVTHHSESGIDLKNPQKSTGMSSGRAGEQLLKLGPNALPKQKEISDIALFLKQFLNLLWVLLLVTDALSLIAFISNRSLTQLWVTLIIFVMIFGMCCISFLHEREALKIVRGFANLLPDQCLVVRDGREQSISAEELVVGDIVIIKNGTRVPADAFG
uniref:Cation_ATPase_N domain-containing protein n=1 Tax=Panagrellus redivivus TaxID=6233 RepID=A0A7E4ZY01_PANRE